MTFGIRNNSKRVAVMVCYIFCSVLIVCWSLSECPKLGQFGIGGYLPRIANAKNNCTFCFHNLMCNSDIESLVTFCLKNSNIETAVVSICPSLYPPQSSLHQINRL
jgi:hypothetical protein